MSSTGDSLSQADVVVVEILPRDLGLDLVENVIIVNFQDIKKCIATRSDVIWVTLVMVEMVIMVVVVMVAEVIKVYVAVVIITISRMVNSKRA